MAGKSKWNKIQNMYDCTYHIKYCNVFDFQWNNIPLEWLSTASSSGHFDYSYACIHHLIIEDFVVEIHHGRLHFFVNSFFFKFFWFYHSYLLFTSYLKNLKKKFFFPLPLLWLSIIFNFPINRDDFYTSCFFV